MKIYIGAIGAIAKGGLMEAGKMTDSVYFVDNDVQQRVLTIEDAIDVMERTYREWDAGRATIRPKTNMYVYDDDADNRYGFSTMEGGSQELGVVAIRIKSDVQPLQREVPRPGTSLPTSASKGAGAAGMFCGLVYLFSTRTGAPLAILNDGYLQHVRVAASAAIAAKHLAREDAETLCILGSQWMARTHAPAMCAVRPIKRIRVYSPNREHREGFAKEMAGQLDIAVEAMDSSQAAVEGADVVCCCTNSFHHPVLSGEWLEDGTFISNVLPSELGEDALARVSYTVKNQPLRSLADHVFQAGSPPPGVLLRSEGAGWLRQVDDSTPLLSAVVAGTARGRASEQEVTFFSNNEGTGLQFAAVGALVLQRLREHADPGVKTLPLDWFLQDIPD